MNVRELIEKLQQLDPELPVVRGNHCASYGFYYHDVEEVKETTDDEQYVAGVKTTLPVVAVI